MRPPAPLVAIMLGASDPVARWLLGIGHTATTAPQWCAPLMARTAFGAAACASAAKRQRASRGASSGIVRERRSRLRHTKTGMPHFQRREPPELALVTDIDHLSL